MLKSGGSVAVALGAQPLVLDLRVRVEWKQYTAYLHNRRPSQVQRYGFAMV